MRLHLNERGADHLDGLPEIGIGNQIVDVVLRNGEQMEWPARAGKISPEDIVEVTRAKLSP